MNQQQEFALKHHCRFAFETMRPGLGFILFGNTSVLLSVNGGWE